MIKEHAHDFISLDQVECVAKDHAFWLGWADFEGAVQPTETMAYSDFDLCEEIGHDIVDCSFAGPDNGNMDHECRRCGQYWSVPLY